MKKNFRIVSAVLLMSISFAYAQNGVTMVGHIDQRHGGPGPNYGFYYASCWGYVAPDGHEYALIGTYSGTSIIDLDATPIAEVAYIAGSGSEWKELKTWGHYAYCVSEASQGVQIINLSQLPDTAWLVRSVMSVGGKNVSRNHTVTVADGYLYLNGSANTGSGGTLILSLADPENPAYVGQYQPDYLHDSYVLRDTLYGAAIYGNGVFIASLQNHAAPQQIGHVNYSGSGTHNTWVSPNGRFLFTTDEIGSTAKNLKAFEITQYQPTFTYTPRTPFTLNPSEIIHNIHGRGNYIYIAHYAAGVYVADVHNPLAIATAGGYDTYAGPGGDYIGCWGVYPYFPSGRFIGSDTQTGLYVFTFSGLAPRTRSTLLAPTDLDTLSLNPPVTFRWRYAASQIEDPHYYQLHIYGPGVDTLMRTNGITLQVGAVPGMQEGQTYNWHVWIKDEFTAVSSADTLQFVYSSSATGVEESPETPTMFSLSQNFPNPFNPTTTIQFTLPFTGAINAQGSDGVGSNTRLVVYTVLGEEVTTLVDGILEAGEHEVKFDATSLPSGVYLYRLTSGGFSEVRKMVVMK